MITSTPCAGSIPHETMGQGGALQVGALTYADLRMAIAVCFTGAFVAALPVIAAVGPVVFWIAIASAAAAFFYTGGPFPLAYYALGEVTVFLAMGIGMVIGTYYVHTGDVTPQAVLLATAMGLLSAGFLHANNVRDIDTDRRQHKRTLANLLGRHAATIEYAILVFVPFACAVLMVILDPCLLAGAGGLRLLPDRADTDARDRASRASPPR